MVTKRDSDIKNFVKRLYYKVFLDGAEYEGEFDDKEKAELLANSIRGKVVTVDSVTEEEKTEQRPPLFSLTGLQREANEKLGYTAADTLKFAQSLYEKKLITYPRTDSKHLTDDMKASLPDLVHSFSESDWFAEHVEVLEKQGLTLDKRIIDNNKVSDHHAIIPTMQAYSATSLSAEENKLLSLIIHRLLAALDKPYKYTDTEYIFDCSDYKFKLKTKTPIEPGFMRFEDKPPQKPKVMYEQGDRFTAGEVLVKDGKSEPPKHYTDSTLLSSMENIDNIFETAELKEYVKGKGLGTPATRAAIIEELISAKYIARQGKNIIATDFGAEFADSLPPKLKNPERTAEWEKWLSEIEEGKTAPDMLLDDVCCFVRKLVEFETTNERPKLQNAVRNQKARESLGVCPRCGKNIFENIKAGNFYCESGRIDEGGCGFTLWAADRIFTDKLTVTKVKALLSGKSIPRSATNKEGVVYSADYRISETEKEKFGERYVNLERVKTAQTEKTELGKCPKCGKAVYEGKLNFYCASASREHKCFTLWKESNKLSFPVTVKMCGDLLKGGKIKVAQKDLDGNSFSAQYELGEYNGSFYLKKV
jgi:DNA topoisomerase-3